MRGRSGGYHKGREEGGVLFEPHDYASITAQPSRCPVGRHGAKVPLGTGRCDRVLRVVGAGKRLALFTESFAGWEARRGAWKEEHTTCCVIMVPGRGNGWWQHG